MAESCDYCKGVGACSKCWGRAAIGEITKKLEDAKGAWNMYANAWQRELGKYMGRNHHHIDACVGGTKDLVMKLEATEVNLKRTQAKLLNEYRASIGEVWHWIGDGTDDLDTLTCPILITPEKLQNIFIKAKHDSVEQLVDAIAEDIKRHADES